MWPSGGSGEGSEQTGAWVTERPEPGGKKSAEVL